MRVIVQQYLTPEQRAEFYTNEKSRRPGRLFSKLKQILFLQS